jgi:hypothetical protein
VLKYGGGGVDFSWNTITIKNSKTQLTYLSPDQMEETRCEGQNFSEVVAPEEEEEEVVEEEEEEEEKEEEEYVCQQQHCTNARQHLSCSSFVFQMIWPCCVVL